MTEPPLLDARDLRVDVGGSVAVERTTFTSRGRSAVLLGDGYGLLAAIAGEGQIRAGTLALLGWDVASEEHRRDPRWVGLAPLDPALPPRFTGHEYLSWAARLGGASRREARLLADRALADLDLGDLERSPLEKLDKPARRALVIAQAVVGDPRVLVASAPLAGLSGSDATYVAAVFSAACRPRRWIATVSTLYAGSPEHALASGADDLLVFASGRLVRSGSLRQVAPGTIGYTITLRGEIEPFRRALEERGLQLSGGPRRWFIDLPRQVSTGDLLALSVQTGAIVVELYPRVHLGEPAVVQEDRTP
jgi:ABC-2 type transport system ATP-binding protein